MHRNPEKVSDMRGLVLQLLDAGKAKEAVELVKKYGTESSELKNAYGVALMRTGEYDKAVELYRGACLYPDSVCYKTNVPAVFMVNYATALLLTKNVSGCLAVLAEIKQHQSDYTRKLRTAIDRWRRSLGWWKRLVFAVYGGFSEEPVALDFPPGELAGHRQMRPAA